MAKIIPTELIKGMSGKVCQHSDVYFSYNASSGKVHTGRICSPSTKSPTDKQLAQQEAFKTRAALLSAWLIANRPSESQPEGSEAYRRALSMKKQLGKSNIRQVVALYMSADGVVTLPGGTSSAAPVVTPGTGGGGTRPGGDDDEGGGV